MIYSAHKVKRAVFNEFGNLLEIEFIEGVDIQLVAEVYVLFNKERKAAFKRIHRIDEYMGETHETTTDSNTTR